MLALIPTPLSDTETRLEMSVSAELGISAEQARLKLVRYFTDDVSMFMGPRRPAKLIINTLDDMAWRFDVVMTWGTKGTLGVIGEVEVDAISGELLIAPEQLAELKANATTLVTSATSGSA